MANSYNDIIWTQLSAIYGTGLGVCDLLAKYWADTTRGNADGLGVRYGDALYRYMAQPLLSSAMASFEDGSTGSWLGVNCVVANTAAQAIDGTKALQLTASSAADMYANTPVGLAYPNQQYSAVLSMRAATAARSCIAELWFLDSASGFISSVNGATVTNSTSAWTTYTVVGTSPPGTAKVLVVGYVVAPANAEVHYLDKVALFYGNRTTWTPGGVSAASQVSGFGDRAYTFWQSVV